jgi:tetratricopeptide (TPR) repeat protein
LLRADLPGEIVGRPEHWPRWRQLLPHVLAATATGVGGQPSPEDTDDTAWLLDRAATYLQTHGQPAQAKPLYERALRIDEAAHGPNHPAVAADLNNLAGALGELGQPGQARQLFERALRIAEAAHGPDHPITAAHPGAPARWLTQACLSAAFSSCRDDRQGLRGHAADAADATFPT